jgi:hypothetical protein
MFVIVHLGILVSTECVGVFMVCPRNECYMPSSSGSLVMAIKPIDTRPPSFYFVLYKKVSERSCT